jgi:hypothetical protein
MPEISTKEDEVVVQAVYSAAIAALANMGGR